MKQPNAHEKIILKYDGQVPRYTSYPTAPHFSDSVGSEKHKKLLSAIDDKAPVSLYFHIPFCEKLCWYCGCATKITRRYSPIENYIYLLSREIRLMREILGRKISVSHIHFGGGTPTILLPKDTQHLFDVIRENFNILDDAEIAMEGDPRTITEDKSSAYGVAGVNRMSFGVQDFDLKVQEAINRVQPFDVVYDAINTCRKSGINSINIDLIYGLPFQNLKKFERTINYSLLLKPDRIALFGYAHVPWMKKHMRLIPEEHLPDSKLRLELFNMASELLEDEGFITVGLDHFVRPEDSMAKAAENQNLNRNFQGYTVDNATNLIGLGVTSISGFDGGFTQNLTSIMQYEEKLKNNELPTSRGIILSKEDKIQQAIIEQVMCYYKVDLNKIASSFDIDIKDIYLNVDLLEQLKGDSIIEFEDNKLSIVTEMFLLVRVVASIFDAYFTMSEKQHSKAV